MAEKNNEKSNKKKSNKKKSANKKTSDKKLTILKRCLFSFIILMLTGIIVLSGYAFAVISKAKNTYDVEKVKDINHLSILLDDKGEEVDEIKGEQIRYIVDLDEIPDNLKNGVVAIEDERFYKHSGVDFKRLIGSTMQTVIAKLTGSKNIAGGSTLTQQIVKNTILSNDVTIERKIKEIYLALEVEKKYDKGTILNLYLNTIPVGGTVYGVEAGAKYYFNKPVKDLNLLQCAYLAGVTQSPSTYNGYSNDSMSSNPKFIKRTKNVLDKMKEHNYITQAEYDEAISAINSKGRDAFEFDKGDFSANTQKYEWFSREAVKQAKKDYKAKNPQLTDEQIDTFFISGVKIYTTMDKDLQENTQKVLDDKANLNIPFKEESDKNGMPLLQSAATIYDYHTGQVKALVGGRQPKTAMGTNRAALDFTRPIGSSTKPLTVYAPGIETKTFTAADAFDDAPLPADMQKKYGSNGEPYNPQNETRNSFKGYTGIREAIQNSINLVAIQAEDKLGLKTGEEYANKFGIDTRNSSGSIAAFALGQYEKGSNTTMMAAAYGTFGNAGIYKEPKLYTKVEGPTGDVVLEATSKEEQIITPETAYIMYDLLRGPVEKGSASGAKVGNIDVVGKTGTTTSNSDYWFAGLTPYYSAAVWIGYDMPKTLEGGSGATAGTLFGKIMQKPHEGKNNIELDKPDGVVKRDVCSISGKLPTDACKSDPRGSQIVSEWFVEDTVPTEKCDIHTWVQVTSNNKLAGANTPPSALAKKVFIKKSNPNKITKDYYLIVPTERDNGNYSDEDKDEDKDKDKDKDKNDGNIDKDNDGMPDKPNTKPNTKPNGDNGNGTTTNPPNPTTPTLPTPNTNPRLY